MTSRINEHFCAHAHWKGDIRKASYNAWRRTCLTFLGSNLAISFKIFNSTNSFDYVINLVGMFPKEIIIHIHRKFINKMFITACVPQMTFLRQTNLLVQLDLWLFPLVPNAYLWFNQLWLNGLRSEQSHVVIRSIPSKNRETILFIQYLMTQENSHNIMASGKSRI